MTDNANPFAQLKSLQSGYPVEPFRDLPRRPNGYREKPEYKEWQQGVRDQHTRILCWYQDQLRLVAPGPKALRLELAGRPIPGHDFRVLADGSVRLDCEYAAKMYPDHEPAAIPAGWTRPLEIPGPGADTAKFMTRNASRNNTDKVWSLQNRINTAAPPSALDSHYRRLPGMDLRIVQNYIDECLEHFVDQLRQILNPEPFQLLNRLHGSPPTHYWTLLEYNLAVLCREPLETAAKVNPGAVACWLDQWRENITPPPHYCQPDGRLPKPRHPSELPPPLPTHPGQIISAVKAQFDRQGKPGWRAFARQPAAHIQRQLHRSRSHPCKIHPPDQLEIALWLNERVHEANLPGLQVKTAAARTPELAAIPAIPEPEAAAQPENGLRQLCLLDADNRAAPIPPAVPKAQHNRNGNRPAGGRTPPPEPPLYLKLMLPELRFARIAPGTDRNRRRAMLGMDAQVAMTTAPTAERETADSAIDHLATLALRHFAGSPELKPKSQERKELFAHLQDITDYCWAEPAAAIQACTFAGLAKASHRWHHEHLLREIAAELETQRIADTTPWQTPCPLPFYDEPGWPARSCPAGPTCSRKASSCATASAAAATSGTPTTATAAFTTCSPSRPGPNPIGNRTTSKPATTAAPSCSSTAPCPVSRSAGSHPSTAATTTGSRPKPRNNSPNGWPLSSTTPKQWPPPSDQLTR